MEAAPHPQWAELPQPLLCAVLALLPVDTRLRCAEVCRRWRAACAERSVWAHVHVTATHHEKREAIKAQLYAAVARAAGGVTSLNLDNLYMNRSEIIELVTPNGPSLRELRLRRLSRWSEEDLEALLRAAPRLLVLEACLSTQDSSAALPAVRNEGIFAPLRLNGICVEVRNEHQGDGEAVLHALLAAAERHAPLRTVSFSSAHELTANAAEALADVTWALRAATLCVCDVTLSPACMPPLARALGSPDLRSVELESLQGQLDAPGASLLGRALRANSELQNVELGIMELWENPLTAMTLLTALVGHPSEAFLDLSVDWRPYQPGASEAACSLMFSLIMADTLYELTAEGCMFEDDVLAAVSAALPHAKSLAKLDLAGNEFTDDAVRHTLLPAVRANESLRKLYLEEQHEGDAASEAMALVEARRLESDDDDDW